MDWKQQSHSFRQMTAQADTVFNIATGDQPESIRGMRVTPGYYNELGGPASFLFGRDFLPEEGVEGKDHVVIVSHRLWERLGENPKMIGSSMSVDGQPHTVVGITRGGILDDGPEITVPLVFTPDQINYDFHWLRVQGRLKPGVTQEQAQADMDAVSANIARANPRSNYGWGVVLASLQKESMPERGRTAFWLLLGAVGFVLLMVCVNIANLLLARGMARQKEIAIRTVLGASKPVIFAQMMTESLALALAGGALGVAMDFAFLRYVIYKAPDFALREAQAGPHVNLIALFFALGITTLCGLFFGYAPAWFAARVNPNESLKEGHAGTNAGRQRLRRVLICGEFALALSLLTGAGLAIHSFSSRIHADVGLRTDHVLTFMMPVPETRPKSRRALLPTIRGSFRAFRPFLESPLSPLLPVIHFSPMDSAWLSRLPAHRSRTISLNAPIPALTSSRPSFSAHSEFLSYVDELSTHGTLPAEFASRSSMKISSINILPVPIL